MNVEETRPGRLIVLLLATVAGAFWFVALSCLGIALFYFSDWNDAHGVVGIAVAGFAVVGALALLIAWVLSLAAASRLSRLLEVTQDVE
jgi:CHASE2 domain-containing sensor protein